MTDTITFTHTRSVTLTDDEIELLKDLLHEETERLHEWLGVKPSMDGEVRRQISKVRAVEAALS